MYENCIVFLADRIFAAGSYSTFNHAIVADVEETDTCDTTVNPAINCINDTPVDPPIYDIPVFMKVEPDTSENTAYGVLLGVPTTLSSNPAYGQVQR